MVKAIKPGFGASLFDRAVASRSKLPKATHRFRIERDLAVPMRDGITLLADHYVPAGTQGRGTILMRTPYGRGLPIKMDARLFAGQGYHVVVQSCRGSFGSGGQFTPMAADIDDGQDTMRWLRAQPWFDGRLATYGASAVGWTQWALLVDPPPELRTAVIIAGFHNAVEFGLGTGAFRLHDLLTWSRVIVNQERFGLLGVMWFFARAAKLNARTVAALPLAEAADIALGHRAPWFRKWLSNQDLSDPFWEPYNASAALEKVSVPIRLVVGWQDLILTHTMRQYEVLHERGLDVTLTVGPWIHQQVVSGANGQLAADNLDWMAEHLAGEPVARKHQPVRFAVTGTDEWREHPHWPPPTTEQVHYLGLGGQLTGQQPQTGTSSFTYDPAHPTPTVAGPLIDNDAGVRDNRDLEARSDVLTFTTPALAEMLEIIGTPVVELHHSTSNPHADVFVRLCDVDAKGRSRNFSETFLRLDPAARDGPLRLRLHPCAHRLAPGHRLRLQVAGGSFPQYMRNEGTGAPPGTGTELRPCRHTIHHGESRLILPVST
ncbi:CocE/NonD family hydrolase [Mycobacterium intracellulare]|uniref:CocE/NonD family hydrolase n=1 Tax=Mycobacterium intracellulare TaxID=1767 RepID=UPI000449F900|nr:CocE/NonD family hydrolase [Mycobacterium intracellulare]ETZ36132.1 hydrolase CocE/NonD family protein [Mycobacterium intracellulare MIN_061107_1834]MCA2273964.1 CocE/NonD family hydrolase [Mycobacterium intracellulare]MCA2324685.1 CocE/NonD family hydrolase [Mycobacterium intracellulare]UEB22613.1 CocE/NonD family hydrolase [Mycobacterium intracellulare]WVL05594.1 CocE/NonD family hydrolase [Mycobacterium intracellulare]